MSRDLKYLKKEDMQNFKLQFTDTNQNKIIYKIYSAKP